MSQLLLPEIESLYPESVLVTIEEEPRILYRVQVASNMRLSCWHIALGTHNRYFLSFASHINHGYRLPSYIQAERTSCLTLSKLFSFS